jgi:hypothetical protein
MPGVMSKPISRRGIISQAGSTTPPNYFLQPNPLSFSISEPYQYQSIKKSLILLPGLLSNQLGGGSIVEGGFAKNIRKLINLDQINRQDGDSELNIKGIKTSYNILHSSISF